MIKAAVFDLDNTLAFVGKPILYENIKLLKEIESSGVRIVVSSGKPVYYLIGMFRQVGLNDPVFIGENGCSIAFGTSLPPKTLKTIKPAAEYFAAREKILSRLYAGFSDKFWLQPNEIALTVFFKDDDTRNKLHEYFAVNSFAGVKVYEHCDSFDVLPVNIDKKTGLEKLFRELNIEKHEAVAVGDGANDLPMMEFCKYSIGVYAMDKNLTSYHFDDIREGLELILGMVKDDRFV